MAEEEWWYKNKDGEKTGPADLDLLEALWLAGDMDGLTLVWKEGMPDFVPLGEVPELRARLVQAGDDQDDLIEEEDGEDQDQNGAPLLSNPSGNVEGGGGSGSGSGAVQTRVGMSCEELWDLQWASAAAEGGTTYYANKYSYESSWTPPVRPTVRD